MYWEALILQVILIALNAIFASAEIAVISMNDTKLKRMADNGDKRAVRLAALTEQPARFLATIQVAITLAGMLSSAFAAENFADPLVAWLMSMGVGVSESVLHSASVLVITVILAYFNLVFGELVPKRIAMKKSEALALGYSGLLKTVSALFAPLVWLLTASTNTILRLMGIDPEDQEEEVSEEEIRMMLEVGNEKGTLDNAEVEMIQNVFAFDDIAAEEICTHRVDVVTLDAEDDMSVWEETILQQKYTCFPVTGEDGDDIIGVLNTKNYFRLKDKSRETVLKEAVEKPYFVPETVKADVLLRNMKRDRRFFAVLLDEYGGLSGIITLSDLLQPLVGDVFTQEEAGEIVRLDETHWRILGSADLEEIEEELELMLPTEEFETFGGYICDVLGRVPDDGSSFTVETEALRITVERVDNHRIQETFVERKQNMLPEQEDMK